MIQIIPAIDIIDGKCVRLTQGDYSQKTIYNEDPLEIAKQFEGNGLTRLHLVDLDGAKKGRVVNQKVLERIAAETRLVIDFGGGIKTTDDISSVFNSGAAIATVGSIAVKEPEKFYDWLNTYGPDRILLGADVKDELVVINAWVEKTGISVFDFIEVNTKKGITQLFCTDVSKDGLLQGPSTQLYKRITTRFPKLNFIASGGVSTAEDIYDLEKAGCGGVIIGKALYEGRITIEQLKKMNLC